MPILRDSPCVSYHSTELLILKKYRIALASIDLNISVLILLVIAIEHKKHARWRLMRMFAKLAAELAEMVDVNSQLACLPRQQSRSQGEYKGPDHFDDSSFYEQFRFRKTHFWMFLQAIGWTLADGAPVLLRFGKKGHRYTIAAHHVMMVFLRRMAFPARWCDLNIILGGSTTTNSDAYNFTLCHIYTRFVPLVQNLERWSNQFPQFAAQLAAMGAPYDNLVSFVDGHFDPTARPGGDACVRRNLWDYQMYNPLHKDHGVMFQGLILVNGIAMCFGPYAGNDNDAKHTKTVVWAGLIETMHTISQQLGRTFSHFADSAYPQSRYMQVIVSLSIPLHASSDCLLSLPQVIQKAPINGQLSRSARRFNALMARFRVFIENLFCEVDQQFAALQHKQNKKLGRQDVMRMFPCAVFLHNIRALCYSNQTAAHYGMDGLCAISLKQFIDAANFQ
jgi:hypothetical protein